MSKKIEGMSIEEVLDPKNPHSDWTKATRLAQLAYEHYSPSQPTRSLVIAQASTTYALLATAGTVSYVAEAVSNRS